MEFSKIQKLFAIEGQIERIKYNVKMIKPKPKKKTLNHVAKFRYGDETEGRDGVVIVDLN